MEIVNLTVTNSKHLANLFFEFWPDETTLKKELVQVKSIVSDKNQEAYLVNDDDFFVGFIHVAIRYEYVDGKTSPFVAYIEGLYLRKIYQNKGIGRKLIKKGEEWAISMGCTQMGSDTGINNENSIGFHKRLGYKEQARYVSFMKNL